jgi:hypothetical protein
MDVMERARAPKPRAGGSSTWRWASPARPRLPARGGAGRALDGPLGYTVALGLPELRAGIAGLYRRWYGVDLDPARVVVTTGSSSAFLLAFTALFDAGDRVAWASRAIPAIARSCARCRLQPVGIPPRDGEPAAAGGPADLDGPGGGGPDRRQPRQPDRHHAGPRRAGGADGLGRGAGRGFVSDEIYHGLHYGDRAVSALEITDRPGSSTASPSISA